MGVWLCLLLLASSCYAQNRTWEVIAKNLETIIIGISFVNETTGWVPGDQNGVGALFLKSSDGGATWKPVKHEGHVIIPMGIAMDNLDDGTSIGVISGLGMGANFTSMLYTPDGETFYSPNPNPNALGESQDAKVIHGLDGAFALPGQYTNFKAENFNGVTISYDGGRTWENTDVGYSVPWVRYGHFPSPTTWYVSAGVWPSLMEWDHDPECRVLSRHIRIHKTKGVQFRRFLGLEETPVNPAGRRLHQTSGYLAAISKTTDAGKTWTTVYNGTGFYFNDIDCPTTTDCWAVGESESDSPTPGVRILHTGDGGQTWDVQLYVDNPNYSLMEIGMVNATEGWALGGEFTRIITGHFWHTSDGGKTWNLEQTVNDEYGSAVSFVPTSSSDYLGWATAFTTAGQSSVLKYS